MLTLSISQTDHWCSIGWHGWPKCVSALRSTSVAREHHMCALTHYSDCWSLAEKAVRPIWSWPIQDVQSAEKNTDDFADGRSHKRHTPNPLIRAHQTVPRPIIWLVCQGLNWLRSTLHTQVFGFSLRTCDEAGDQQGQDQHLEHSHEQFPREGEVFHLAVGQFVWAHGEAQDYTWKEKDLLLCVIMWTLFMQAFCLMILVSAFTIVEIFMILPHYLYHIMKICILFNWL